MSSPPFPPDSSQSVALGAVMDELRDVERRIRALDARKTVLLGEAAHLAREESGRLPADGRSAEMAHRVVAAETGIALGLADRTADHLLARADRVCTRHTALLPALAAGDIGSAHVTAIAEAGAILESAHARDAYMAELVEYARSHTPNRTRRVAKILAEKHAGSDRRLRYQRAHEERRIWISDLGDGMAELHAIMDAVSACAVHDRLTRHARVLRRADLDVQRTAAEHGMVRGGAPGPGAGAGAGAGPVPGTAPGHGPDVGVGSSTAGSSTAGSSTAGPSAAGPSAAGPSAAGSSTAGPSTAGSNTAGSSTAGPPDRVAVPQPRSLDQLRVDLFVDLLLGRAVPTSEAGSRADGTSHADGISREQCHGIQARVQVTVPMEMLIASEGGASPGLEGAVPGIGARGQPAVLAGYGPIDGARARLLASLASGWDRVAHDARTGEVLAVDRYRPSEEIRRFLRARDQHCRFPGCTVVPFRADADHTIDAALGGETSVQNMAVLCRRHHMMKHHAGIRMRQRAGGDIEWISTLGSSTRERAPSRVLFRPAVSAPSPTAAPSPTVAPSATAARPG